MAQTEIDAREGIEAGDVEPTVEKRPQSHVSHPGELLMIAIQRQSVLTGKDEESHQSNGAFVLLEFELIHALRLG